MNDILGIARRLRKQGRRWQALARKVARQRVLREGGKLDAAYLKSNSHWDGLEKRGA